MSRENHARRKQQHEAERLMISVKRCSTTSGTHSRTRSTMNGQKQTESIDRKIRELMILIASVHDFNIFLQRKTFPPEKNANLSSRELFETFQIKNLHATSCCETLRQIFIRFYEPIFVFQLLKVGWQRKGTHIPDQQKIISVWKFVTYFRIFRWHARERVDIILQQGCVRMWKFRYIGWERNLILNLFCVTFFSRLHSANIFHC